MEVNLKRVFLMQQHRWNLTIWWLLSKSCLQSFNFPSRYFFVKNCWRRSSNLKNRYISLFKNNKQRYSNKCKNQTQKNSNLLSGFSKSPVSGESNALINVQVYSALWRWRKAVQNFTHLNSWEVIWLIA